MKHSFFIVLLALLFCFRFLAAPVVAQQVTPSPLTPTPTGPDLEVRLSALENQQDLIIKDLNSRVDQAQTVITWIGAVLTALVILQGILAVVQTRREGAREGKITEILSIVEETLQKRLDAEKQEREKAEAAQKELHRFKDDVNDFLDKFQKNIADGRAALEKFASDRVTIPRHDFRRIAGELSQFTKDFDAFQKQYEPLELQDGEKEKRFSPRVYYILGIAAHYNNRPETAKDYLSSVIKSDKLEMESDRDFRKRIANAYYYLGIIELNFGNPDDAITSFDDANRLDSQRDDFLTKVVTAEAYVMSGSENFDKADVLLRDIERDFAKKERAQNGHLELYHMRLRSRAALIKVNAVLLAHGENWLDEAKSLLEPAYAATPSYYFATATLAQLFHEANNVDRAGELFREAYQSIVDSGDLFRVTETRSLILLLMVAGMCSLHGLGDERRCAEYLDRAKELCEFLPQIGKRYCTVFSPLSKKNESSEILKQHIAMIHEGKIFAVNYVTP